MQNKQGLIGLLMVGCLAIVPSMQGCSGGGGGSDGGTDAGHTDGGHPDSGTPDSGTPGVDHSLGARCADGRESPFIQSDCDRGLVCVDISANNICTIQGCQSNTDCGMNGSAQNYCFQLGSSASDTICIRGCDPSQQNPCGRPDFVCATETGNNNQTITFCTPDCRAAGDAYVCSYPGQCNQTTGLCDFTPCSNTGTCAAGSACYTDNSVTPAEKDCVPDCTVSGNTCPAASACNSAATADEPKGTCSPIVAPFYGDCGPDTAHCPGETATTNPGFCLAFDQAGNGLCSQICSVDADCPSSPAGTKCVDIGGGKTCLVPCTAGADAGASACPTGTTCNTYGQGASAITFCGK